MRIRWTDDASCLNPGIDGFSKTAVFHDSDRLAWEIRQTLPLSCFLHTATVHPEDTPVFAHLQDLLHIDISVKPEFEGLNEGMNPSSGCHIEPFHYPLSFDHGEFFPGFFIQLHGCIHPEFFLDSSEPETVMGELPARYAVRMAEVVAGDRQRMRAQPPLSVLICTIAPLGQDPEGIEAGMVYAEAGIPVGFMAMPNMGSSAPAAPGGALVLANAEVVSATVLMQLVAPGAPVFHSILASVMDPRTAEYVVAIPEKYLCNAAAVHLAHDWGVPSLGGAFGMDSPEPATWQLGRDSVYTTLMVPLAGAEILTGGGMLKASTLLLPEQIIFDDEIYHTHRLLVEGIDERG